MSTTLKQLKKNVLTSSTAKVIARVGLLQATKFIADSWRRVSSKIIQN
jgi:hypothetical protein